MTLASPRPRTLRLSSWLAGTRLREQTSGQAADAAMLAALQSGASSRGWTNAGLLDPFVLTDPVTVTTFLTRLVVA